MEKSSFPMKVPYTMERFYPITLGVISCVVFLIYAKNIQTWMNSHEIKADGIYAPIGGIFVIIAGFLASFYGSIQSIADTRLKRISKTFFFIRFLKQIKEATISGFFLSILSVPLMIVAPSNFSTNPSRMIVSIWVGSLIYCLAAFMRVGTKLFVVFEHQPPKDLGAH